LNVTELLRAFFAAAGLVTATATAATSASGVSNVYDNPCSPPGVATGAQRANPVAIGARQSIGANGIRVFPRGWAAWQRYILYSDRRAGL